VTLRKYLLWLACLLPTPLLADANFNYTDGQDYTLPIHLTERHNYFYLASGTATQSGSLSGESNTNIWKRGAGNIVISGPTNVEFIDVMQGSVQFTANNSHVFQISVRNIYGPALAEIAGINMTSRVVILGTDATLRVTGGSHLDMTAGYSNLLIGNGGSNAHLLISGANSRVSTTGALAVGYNGTARLTLSDGGRLSFTMTPGLNDYLQLGSNGGIRGTVNIGSASGEAAAAPGLLDVWKIGSGNGSGEIVFNHTSSNYVFTRTGTAAGSALQLHGNLDLVFENGVTTMRDANTRTGNIAINGGTVLVSEVATDSALGKGAVTVGPNGRLGGNGAVEGLTTVSGTLAPGTSVGSMRFQNGLTLQASARVEMELGGLARSTQFDAIDVTGPLAFDGELNIRFTNGFTPENGATFDLFDGVYAATGNFTSITFTETGYQGAFDPGTGILTVNAVPEASPMVWLLAAGGLIPVRLPRRRQPRLSGGNAFQASFRSRPATPPDQTGARRQCPAPTR
jgi:T5SS/PEP-CTERM-associated repeat protein